MYHAPFDPSALVACKAASGETFVLQSQFAEGLQIWRDAHASGEAGIWTVDPAMALRAVNHVVNQAARDPAIGAE